MTQYEIVDRGGVRDQLGEGLLWSQREGALYWTDILAPALNRLTLATGAVDRWPMAETIGWVVEREDAPGLIAGLRTGFVALTLDPVTVSPFAAPDPHPVINRLNDAKADSWGRIWAGSMPMKADQPSGHLFRLDPDGTISHADSGYHVANGPAISADGRWLFHTDSVAGHVYRFALDEGGISGKELFIRFEEGWGSPDGMTFDTEGGLWIACWGAGRVARFDELGRMTRTIDLPASQISNVCFGGPNFATMFVTSASIDKPDEPLAGSLFQLDAGMRGRPAHRFAG
jgi:sugar lactone lactonase YvrE